MAIGLHREKGGAGIGRLNKCEQKGDKNGKESNSSITKRKT